MQTASRTSAGVTHPLDPLTADEVTAASQILKREQGLKESARFVTIALKEPAKPSVLAFKDGDPIDRQASIVLRERSEKKTYEAVVSISGEQVVSFREVAGVQPSIMLEEFLTAEEAVKNDPRWQEAMRKRGVNDFSLAILDPWSVGWNGPQDDPDKGRFVRPLTWLRSGEGEFAYARPVEGLVTLFNLDTNEVVSVDDHGVVPLTDAKANYEAGRISDAANFPRFPDGPRQDLKPIEITQPSGTSFQVDGHRVRWQKWSFRIGFTPREGLVLYTIAYHDKGRDRSVIYRASLSEMFIPYGDPAPTHHRKNVFDMGEYGVGALANSLELGCDCLGEIQYFDGVVNDNDGNPIVLQNAVCMHEEDFGMLWKHQDFRTMATEVRRSRRLVVSMVATVGNYEYGYYWYLYQDGSIEYEVKMTGVMSNGAIAPGEKPKYGEVVAPGIYGPNHQHFFSVRLDMAVDGANNSVYECDSAAVPPGPDNPHGNAWTVNKRLLKSESEAQRTVEPMAARYWKISNPEQLNALGEPVAYKLMPGENILPFYQPEAPALKRAQFTTKHLWVTAYDPAEMYAAGDYPNQHPGGAGLPEYTKDDRPIENTDVVVWYTFGAHHPVRPEEWPVMPVNYIGFHLKPQGFFDGNPALDVPVPAACHHPAAEHNGH
ncbi:MAG TPA: primary-amine oxidase [Candidatus Dormibacteraeota bacterium]